MEYEWARVEAVRGLDENFAGLAQKDQQVEKEFTTANNRRAR